MWPLTFPLEINGDPDAGGDALVLLRQNARVVAYHNICPHAGRRLDWAPGQFLIEDGYIICAAHGALFAIESGLCVGGPCRGESLRQATVAIQDDQVVLIAEQDR